MGSTADFQHRDQKVPGVADDVVAGLDPEAPGRSHSGREIVEPGAKARGQRDKVEPGLVRSERDPVATAQVDVANPRKVPCQPQGVDRAPLDGRRPRRHRSRCGNATRRRRLSRRRRPSWQSPRPSQTGRRGGRRHVRMEAGADVDVHPQSDRLRRACTIPAQLLLRVSNKMGAKRDECSSRSASDSAWLQSLWPGALPQSTRRGRDRRPNRRRCHNPSSPTPGRPAAPGSPWGCRRWSRTWRPRAHSADRAPSSRS